MKLFQANYQNRQVFILADSIAGAIQTARQHGFEDDPIWVGVVGVEGQNLVVQSGYVLQPARVN